LILPAFSALRNPIADSTLYRGLSTVARGLPSGLWRGLPPGLHALV
jgi:hypothetical protein